MSDLLHTEWPDGWDGDADRLGDLSLLDDPLERRRGLRHRLHERMPRPPVTFGHARAAARVFAFILVMLLAIPLLALGLLFRLERWRTQIVRTCYKILCRCLGLRIVRIGPPADLPSTLYIANHMSYFDIVVLGSLLPASFISRGDIAHWPLIGFLAKLQRTVYTARSRATADAESRAIRSRLEAGDSLLMFPEGTSGDALHLLPFKSTFFAVATPLANGKPVTVQPISMAVTELGDLPIGRHQRHLFAWYGDMDFASHFWAALQQPGFTVEVRFHAPTTIKAAGDRKALARYCEQAITEGFDRSLSGRETPEGSQTAAPQPLQPKAAL